MENGVGENGDVCSTETGNREEDVYSSKESDASSADHLVVMVHGILGRYFSCILVTFFGEIICFSVCGFLLFFPHPICVFFFLLF